MIAGQELTAVAKKGMYDGFIVPMSRVEYAGDSKRLPEELENASAFWICKVTERKKITENDTFESEEKLIEEVGNEKFREFLEEAKEKGLKVFRGQKLVPGTEICVKNFEAHPCTVRVRKATKYYLVIDPVPDADATVKFSSLVVTFSKNKYGKNDWGKIVLIAKALSISHLASEKKLVICLPHETEQITDDRTLREIHSKFIGGFELLKSQQVQITDVHVLQKPLRNFEAVENLLLRSDWQVSQQVIRMENE